MPARFEGEAARLPEHLEVVAKILSRDSIALVTPTERKEAAAAIRHALKSASVLTTFLSEAPAEAVLACRCEGCEHLKNHLAELRKIAHR